jgi:hypothetical protein
VYTLNGEREGFFGAVAANYLRGVIDAQLRVIVPEDDEMLKDDETISADATIEEDDKGLCTNKFGEF